MSSERYSCICEAENSAHTQTCARAHFDDATKTKDNFHQRIRMTNTAEKIFLKVNVNPQKSASIYSHWIAS